MSPTTSRTAVSGITVVNSVAGIDHHSSVCLHWSRRVEISTLLRVCKRVRRITVAVYWRKWRFKVRVCCELVFLVEADDSLSHFQKGLFYTWRREGEEMEGGESKFHIWRVRLNSLASLCIIIGGSSMCVLHLHFQGAYGGCMWANSDPPAKNNSGSTIYRVGSYPSPAMATFWLN